jgi:hypothetical protein
MSKKSVISLISYDASYLPASIKSYYPYVDEIILGLDQDRISWSGNAFTFDEAALWTALKAIDKDNKISIIEDNFHQSEVAIENDNYERNFLKNECSHDWIFSFDADEQLLNAKDFFYNYCPIVDRYKERVDICMTWATPYKIIDDTVLVIANEDNSAFFGENQGFATSSDSTYTYARWTDKSAAGQNRVMSPLVSIHWSLCRPEEALYEKIHNIGHSDIVETDPFYEKWKNVTLENYEELRNFKTSGLGEAQWPKLFALPLEQLESYYNQQIARCY